MTDFSYKKYSLEQLDNWVNDALNCDDLSPQDMYDTIVKCVEESVEYHKKYLDKSVELLSLLKGHRPVEIDTSTKDKEREYNLREAEYYNKRARLDAISKANNKDWTDFWEGKSSDDEFDEMLSQYGYEYTPNLPNRY